MKSGNSELNADYYNDYSFNAKYIEKYINLNQFDKKYSICILIFFVELEIILVEENLNDLPE